MAYIVCDNLKYLYSVGTPFETAALDGVSVEVSEGDLIGIIGHTGSGKSTLIQHMNGLLEANSGKVFIDGNDIWEKKNRKQIRQVRFAVGLCFQYPEYQIFEESVYREIAFGPKQMGLDDEEIDKRVRSSMDFVGMDFSLAEVSPFDLSGGQKRRVAIASILAMQPKVLILDEPCAGLDPQGRDRILDLIKSYQYSMGNTVILVSHSMEDVAKLCNNVIVMNKHKIAMQGTVDEVYSRGEELKVMGLNVPEITDVFLKLKADGVDCRTNIYTVEQGLEELGRLLKGGAVSD
jgi:energy-coupling factor transport system ATP-binding protein